MIMAKNLILPVCCCLLAQWLALPLRAQVVDNFNDGNFSSNPPWTGSTASWTVNTALRLQSNNTVANSSFYLATPSKLATGAQWELYVQLAFNPSSANYVDIYLAASAADLTQDNTTGYFVRVGNTNDEVCLYRKDFTGLSVMLINGTDGILNTSNNTLKIKVTRDAANRWTLFRDLSGTGNNYISEGSATDDVYTSSAYFGLLIKQSTSSFFQKHFFDDIEVSPYAPDTIPPAIVSASTASANELDLLFSEPVDPSSSQATGNYFADNMIGFPSSATRDAANPALVHLLFGNTFPNGVNCRLTVNHVQDLSGNTLKNAIVPFSFYTVQPYDVVIDEIMADPNPQVGLPPYEFLELKIVSSQAVDLYGWQVGDSVGFATFNTHVLLLPDSFLVVTANASAPSLANYGTTIGAGSFPTLNNDGDELYLRSNEGKTIHAVAYTSSWYQNDIKSKGGWTLEMIDTKNPCSGAGNWSASIDAKGGTPGHTNSIDAVNTDTQAPVLLSAFPGDSSTLLLFFDEPLDSLNAADPGHYTISYGKGIPRSAVPIPPLFNTVQLTLAASLGRDTIYTITANDLSDCSGNKTTAADTARVAIPSIPDSTDIVINEVLFNPRPGGVDYVELYNRSHKTIDLGGCYIANRAASGVVGSEKPVSTSHRLLFPQDYLVVTEDPALVQQQYICKNPRAFATVGTLPSYPNDQGDVVVLNSRGAIIDELAYNENWQFKLIADDEGVALERIDYDKPTQDAGNWHSASTSSGYGTPTWQNSQYRGDPQENGMITVTPPIFSPDNDGWTILRPSATGFPNRAMYAISLFLMRWAGRCVISPTMRSVGSTVISAGMGWMKRTNHCQ